MKNIKIIATQCLLDLNIANFPIDFERIKEIVRDRGWILKPYSAASEVFETFGLADYASSHDSFSLFLDDGTIAIFYKDTLSSGYRLHVLAHEFGHIMLEHTSLGVIGKDADSAVENIQEQEAEEFAAYFLAPPCLMKKCHIKDIGKLEELTLIDGPFAKQLYANLRLQTSDLSLQETALIRQCQEFIKKHNLNIHNSHLKITIAACALATLFIITAAWMGISKLTSFDSTDPATLVASPVNSSPDLENEENIAKPVAVDEIVYWSTSGHVFHTNKNCPSLSQATLGVHEGTKEEAIDAGKDRLCKFCGG